MNNNFTFGELQFIKYFNKINKNIHDNTYDKQDIKDEIDYLINKISKIVPTNKSAMINFLNIIKKNIN